MSDEKKHGFLSRLFGKRGRKLEKERGDAGCGCGCAPVEVEKDRGCCD